MASMAEIIAQGSMQAASESGSNLLQGIQVGAQLA